MEYLDLIRIRESVRDYDPQRPVSKEVLEKILNAAHMAPSACNNQPWEFWVIQSPAMLEKVRSCYHRPWFKERMKVWEPVL
jgi:nitroreductase